MVSLNRRKHAVYIRLVAFMSVVSFVIVCVSLGTQDWIRATAYPTIGGVLVSTINYGLFTGELIRRPLATSRYDLYISCVWPENACAWSCASTAEARKTEVQQLVEGKKVDFTCMAMQTAPIFPVPESQMLDEMRADLVMTNAGLWVSTIIFIVILMISLAASFALAVINCMTSPIETLLNVQGIYVTNAVALGANFMVLLLYGICYDVYIKKNISILDTLVGDYTSEAKLGYSYWVLHVPCIFHGLGIFIIAMREKIVNSDRAETRIDVATELPASGVLY